MTTKVWWTLFPPMDNFSGDEPPPAIKMSGELVSTHSDWLGNTKLVVNNLGTLWTIDAKIARVEANHE